MMERMRDAAGEGKRHVVNRHSLHHPCAAFVLVLCSAAILMCRPLCVLKYRAEGSCMCETVVSGEEHGQDERFLIKSREMDKRETQRE